MKKFFLDALAWIIKMPVIFAIIVALLGLWVMVVFIDVLNWAWNRGQR